MNPHERWGWRETLLGSNPTPPSNLGVPQVSKSGPNHVSAHKLDPEESARLLEGRNNFRQILTDMKQLYINNQSEFSTTGLALSSDETELFALVCHAMDELIERLEREVTP